MYLDAMTADAFDRLRGALELVFAPDECPIDIGDIVQASISEDCTHCVVHLRVVFPPQSPHYPNQDLWAHVSVLQNGERFLAEQLFIFFGTQWYDYVLDYKADGVVYQLRQWHVSLQHIRGPSIR